MKHFRPFYLAVVVFLILITGCKKETSSYSNEELQTTGNPAAQQLNSLSPKLKAKLAGLRIALPAGYEKRLQINAALLLKMHPEYRNMVNRALNVSQPAACDNNTPINQWLGRQLDDWDNDVIFFAIITGMLDLPTYDALIFDNNSTDESFGVNGEYTQQVYKTFKDLKRFWNVQSNNIVVEAIHGSMLRSRDKIIRTDMALYGDSPSSAAYYADLILSLLRDVPQYRNGDHPIFSFNSYALKSFNFYPLGVVPAKILMGDGILQAFTAIGYNDVAPQAILGHEFGHQIQFQLGVFGLVTTPEATRRTELMADAYSAYYLSHARGAAMQWKRVKQFLQVFFNIGDCAIYDDGHHGTPTQRMAAAEWGYNVANNAQKQGQILTSQQFTTLFELQLPELLTH